MSVVVSTGVLQTATASVVLPTPALVYSSITPGSFQSTGSDLPSPLRVHRVPGQVLFVAVKAEKVGYQL